MIKSVIFIVCAFIFMIINVLILFLKPEFNFAINDDDNYCVRFQRWINTSVFMGTIIVFLFTIYLALEYKHLYSFLTLLIEFSLVIIYALLKYKAVIVQGDEIKIERLFRKELVTKFNNINLVTYYPNAKLLVKLKKNGSFDVSFNSEYFHKFYKSLLKNDVKFKTTHIPYDQNHVCINKYNMSVCFPKTMFREYYESKKNLRNSTYLFSARSLEKHQYIEGYFKESELDTDEFVEIINSDLKINGFNPSKKIIKEKLDIFDFTIINALSEENPEQKRQALIFKEDKGFLVIYADYLESNEDQFLKALKEGIHETRYEEAKSTLVRI